MLTILVLAVSLVVQTAPEQELNQLRAENRMLRVTVERQQAHIARLQAKLDEIEHADAATRPSVPAPVPTRDGRVVFVCDATGSMLNHFAAVRNEIAKALKALRADQSFELLTFQEDRAQAFAHGLVKATPHNVARAIEFVDAVTPKGGGEPDVGIRAALQLNPDAIWLISDGSYGREPEEELQSLVRLLAGSSVRINTAAFLNPHELWPGGWILRSLAVKTGGRAVDETGADLPEITPPPPPPPPTHPTGPSIFRER